MSVFTAEEIKLLILALCGGTPGGATEEQIVQWMEWCRHVRVDALLLDMVLREKLLPRMKDGEVDFISTSGRKDT